MLVLTDGTRPRADQADLRAGGPSPHFAVWCRRSCQNNRLAQMGACKVPTMQGWQCVDAGPLTTALHSRALRQSSGRAPDSAHSHQSRARAALSHVYLWAQSGPCQHPPDEQNQTTALEAPKLTRHGLQYPERFRLLILLGQISRSPRVLHVIMPGR